MTRSSELIAVEELAVALLPVAQDQPFGARSASRDELRLAIALQVEQRGQVAMVDADAAPAAATAGLACSATPVPASLSMSRSLAPSPTAMASAGVRPRRAAISAQRLDLGRAAEDRLGDLAGEPAVRLDQAVGAVLVEAEHRGDAAR